MKSFNQGSKFGRRDSDRSSYGKPSSGRFERRDNRSSGRFNNDDGNRSSRREFNPYEKRERGSFDRGDAERPHLGKRFEKEMHRVTCDKCGEKCEVPFRPTKDKPVYCYQCFKKDGDKGGTYGGGESRHSEQFTREFEQINEKLDKILSALGAD